MKFTKLSVICTLLSYPTIFLMITIVVLPALGLIFGAISFRQHMRAAARPEDRRPLIAALPMIFAVVSFVLEIAFVNATYRA